MLNIDDVSKEIEMLERGQITYPVLEKLSVLYAIQDHHRADTPRYSLASAPASEFLQKVNEAPLDGVLQILDKHMDCIKVLYPKEYTAIIEKIDELRW